MNSEIQKSKVMQKIEGKMDELDPGSLRYMVLDSAKKFKNSWIDLGQSLYTVWKDKHFKQWGFTEFETYTKKEIGIRSTTALKLLRSYNFLEKEEPKYLAKEFHDNIDAARVPMYETVDVLRKAGKRSDIDSGDFKQIKKNVLEKGKDAKDAALVIGKYVQQPEVRLSDVDLKKKKYQRVKRFIGLLKSVKAEIFEADVIEKDIILDMDSLLSRLENNISKVMEDGKDK